MLSKFLQWENSPKESINEVRIVGLLKLKKFKKKHVDVSSQIDAWIYEVRSADWRRSIDIKKRYSSASFLSGNLVVFNLKGNDYRLLVKVNYRSQIVLVMRIGTHAEYDNWSFREVR